MEWETFCLVGIVINGGFWSGVSSLFITQGTCTGSAKISGYKNFEKNKNNGVAGWESDM